MLVIDAQTGTILNIDECYVVNTDDIDDTDVEMLESGNDGDVAKVAEKYGTLITELIN
jgi:hypothetical protein